MMILSGIMVKSFTVLLALCNSRKEDVHRGMQKIFHQGQFRSQLVILRSKVFLTGNLIMFK